MWHHCYDYHSKWSTQVFTIRNYPRIPRIRTLSKVDKPTCRDISSEIDFCISILDIKNLIKHTNKSFKMSSFLGCRAANICDLINEFTESRIKSFLGSQKWNNMPSNWYHHYNLKHCGCRATAEDAFAPCMLIEKRCKIDGNESQYSQVNLCKGSWDNWRKWKSIWLP